MRVNLIGKRFHKFIVLQHIGIKGRTDIWKARCDCGKEFEAITSIIKKRKSCGCAQKNVFKDLSGLKLNKVTLLRCIGKNKYSSYIYDALCDCGKKFICEGNDVKTERLRSCGCQKYQHAKDNADYIGTLWNELFCDYRIKAKQRSLDFFIDKKNLISMANKRCHYCNSEPRNTKKHKSLEYSIQYNGIDRLNNDIGYILENCVPCCYFCNQAKHSMTVDKFKDWVMSLMKAIEEKKGIWV